MMPNIIPAKVKVDAEHDRKKPIRINPDVRDKTKEEVP